jgi:hypothetical protein
MLPEVARKVDTFDADVFLAQRGYLRPGIIRTRIVDEDKLEVREGLRNTLFNSLVEFQDKLTSHINRDNDR